MSDITIRIPVVVNSHGNWNAMGWNGVPDDVLLDSAFEGILDDPVPGYVERVYWITATVQVPEPQIVEITEVEVVPADEPLAVA